MKNLFYLFTLSMAFAVSCSPQEEKPLTDTEKETLKGEVAARIDEIVTASNQMNLEAIKEIYWNDPAFIAVSLDQVFNYQGYIQDAEEVWSGIESLNFQEGEVQISILDSETAYAVFGGMADAQTTEGQEMKIEDFFASMLFRKVDGSWKVAGTHESGTFVMMEEEMEADSLMME
ncbi:nuclear transport factor 2 family protein [Robertkochia aurantiaca]|uniref:nuclear transport factor 2 family protein n=1 Tax=Robertkochia aurantiaca TaxID=2873700 RepID=UPI001CCB4B6D|nr:nuclear transport factor 2 family protein [Robertkochia sp. 3YJGBD-33]